MFVVEPKPKRHRWQVWNRWVAVKTAWLEDAVALFEDVVLVPVFFVVVAIVVGVVVLKMALRFASFVWAALPF